MNGCNFNCCQRQYYICVSIVSANFWLIKSVCYTIATMYVLSRDLCSAPFSSARSCTFVPSPLYLQRLVGHIATHRTKCVCVSYFIDAVFFHSDLFVHSHLQYADRDNRVMYEIYVRIKIRNNSKSKQI